MFNFIHSFGQHFQIGTAALVLMLAAKLTFAAPKLDSLRANDRGAYPACSFQSIDPTNKHGPVELELGFYEATIRINGKALWLAVRERNCRSNCVMPRHSGIRVFDLTGPGVIATLTKVVTCGRDAEACGGLPEGEAILVLGGSSRSASVRVWGMSCDR